MKNVPSYNTLAENRRHIFGTSLQIGNIELKTIYGTFVAYVFQDLINKGYVMALVFGDINAPRLYTRMHSSCVTSETLRSLDCDCVKQLNGAMQIISENQNGILFYLIQEGRGCGYVAKSRDKMFTQYNPDLTTFDAYQMMGMKPDYRTYNNIADICKILEIPKETKWILLTNNPDKVKGFKEIGLEIEEIEFISIKPNIFNQGYLFSKKEFGHLLYMEKKKSSILSLPKNPVEPFEPYSLPSASRFFYTSAYYLPIKPVKHQIIISKEEFDSLIPNMELEFKRWIKYQKIASDKYLIKILNKDVYTKYPDFLSKPYWFKVNVFFDIASGTDFVVLEYGDVSQSGVKPIVRIHSESLMNRFPLSYRKYKVMYKRVLESIVKHGAGLIVLLYHDGRGAGLGCYVLEKNLADVSKLGIKAENRDFEGALTLVKEFVGENEVRVLTGKTSQSIIQKTALQIGVKICQINEIMTFDKDLGHQSIADRIDLSEAYVKNNIIDNESVEKVNFNSPMYYVTGVGSSETHAIHLSSMLNIYTNIKAVFVPLVAFYENSSSIKKEIPCIVFSQGLSPNIKKALEFFEYKNIIAITTVHEHHRKKDRIEAFKKILENNGQIIHYNEEIPDNTLIRILGPMSIFVLNLKIIEKIMNKKMFNYEQLIDFLENLNINRDKIISPYIEKMMETDQICLLAGSKVIPYLKNVYNKFLEGPFYSNTMLIDFISFSHGTFQCFQQMEATQREKYILFALVDDENAHFVEKVQKMNPNNEVMIYQMKMKDELQIVELEAIFNLIIFFLIYKLNIDQVNWKGKVVEEILYSFS